MEFELSETQRMMQQAARGFLADQCPSTRVRQIMETETALDPALWRAMAEQGWCGMTLPEKVGGLELGAVELAAVAEEMGRACVPGPFLSNLWAATLLAAVADRPAWAEELLAGIAAGERHATVALLEDESDWNPDAVRMPIEQRNGGLLLNGRKTLVGDAAIAERLLVVGRLNDQLAVVAVAPDDKGVSLKAAPAVDATRKLLDVEFQSVALDADRLVAQGPAAETALARATQTATVGLCAELLGGMQWVLETAVEYAKTRKQFDRPIGSFQAVQHQCADMLLLVESARSATYYAAWALSESEPNAAEAVSIAKVYVSDAAREVGNRGIQVHGGIGFTWEHDLQLYYKRFRAGEFLFGDATHHREHVATSLLKAVG